MLASCPDRSDKRPLRWQANDRVNSASCRGLPIVQLGICLPVWSWRCPKYGFYLSEVVEIVSFLDIMMVLVDFEVCALLRSKSKSKRLVCGNSLAYMISRLERVSLSGDLSPIHRSNGRWNFMPKILPSVLNDKPMSKLCKLRPRGLDVLLTEHWLRKVSMLSLSAIKK